MFCLIIFCDNVMSIISGTIGLQSNQNDENDVVQTCALKLDDPCCIILLFLLFIFYL